MFTYSNINDFDLLWGFLERGTGSLPWSLALIVFDGQPERTNHPYRPELWLTPWDWAIASSAALVEQPSRIGPNGFRCWILDLLPATGSQGRQRFRAAAGFAPWIRWYRPKLASGDRLYDDVEQLFNDLGDVSHTEQLGATTGDAINPKASSLTAAWHSVFAAPADRHGIGNLVGPLLLAEGVERQFGVRVSVPSDRSTRYFRALLKTVGMTSAPEIPASRNPDALPLRSNPGFWPSADEDPFRQFQRLRLSLVDDHYRVGYHDVLTQVLIGLGAAETRDADRLHAENERDGRLVTVTSFGTPGRLLHQLEGSFRLSPSWGMPRTIGESTYDILFLDLRLFPESTSSQPSGDEREFLRALLSLCSSTSSTLPVDERLNTALSAAQRRQNGGPEELAALALLPLLISHADPSLPVVLFSSTHQREIVDALKHRPNIITTFSKPIVTGYSTIDAGSTAVLELVESIRDALRLHRIRPVWEAIVRLGRLAARGPVAISESTLNVTTRTGPRPLRYGVTWDAVDVLRNEFVSLLAQRRYADALMTPHNTLESMHGDREYVAPVWPIKTDDTVARAQYVETNAAFQFYRILKELRNARAHYNCRPIVHDAQLETVACWTWLLFIHGVAALMERRRPIAGLPVDEAALLLARDSSWLPQVRGLQGSRRETGADRCRQIIGKFGHLLEAKVVDCPTPPLRFVADYAIALAAGQAAKP